MPTGRNVLVLAVAALLGGCASARYVLLEPEGGVVAMASNTPRHRAEAVALMEAKCPSGYAIEREEEAPVGSTIRTRVREEPSLSGDRVTATRRSWTETEWRINFRCR